MKRIISILLLVAIFISYIYPLTFMKSGISNVGVRSNCDFENCYIDDTAIALADVSSSNTKLRAESIKAYNMVNEQRINNGLNALSWNSNLEVIAAVRAEEASVSFSHTRPNGKAWYSVNSNIMAGENLAYGFDDAGSALTAWMNSPTHKENILWPEFNEIAIAVYVTDNGTYYWSQEFGY